MPLEQGEVLSLGPIEIAERVGRCVVSNGAGVLGSEEGPRSERGVRDQVRC